MKKSQKVVPKYATKTPVLGIKKKKKKRNIGKQKKSTLDTKENLINGVSDGSAGDATHVKTAKKKLVNKKKKGTVSDSNKKQTNKNKMDLTAKSDDAGTTNIMAVSASDELSGTGQENAGVTMTDGQKKRKNKQKKKRKSSEGDSTLESKKKKTEMPDSTSDAITDKAESPKKRKTMPTIRDPEQESRTVFVGNVDIKTQRKDLHRFFKKYGKVECLRFRCAAIADPKKSKKETVCTGKFHPSRSTLNVYVRFVTRDMAEAACAANGMEFKGTHLQVNKANTNENHAATHAVFVGNLPYDTEEEKLRSHFIDCGVVKSVRVIRDNQLQLAKGFGYVNFMKADSVEIALHLDGKLFMNRRLRVQRCNDKVRSRKKKKDYPQSAQVSLKRGMPVGTPSQVKQGKRRGGPVKSKMHQTRMELKEGEKVKIKQAEKGGNKQFEKKGKKQQQVNKIGGKQKFDTEKVQKKESTLRKRNESGKPMYKQKGPGAFSGKKMIETTRFKKIKKQKKKKQFSIFDKDERKKYAIARKLTGAKPMAKKAQ